MRTRTRFLISLAAVAAAGLVGCLNSPESSQSMNVPVSEAEIQAALTGDSLKPVRPVVCDTLKARLGALDSTAANFEGLSNAVARVCAIHPPRPDSGAVRPPHPPRPDSLRADSLGPRPDSLRPLPPKPPKPDSLRPLPPVKPDSGKPAAPKPPKPPKKK